MIKRPGLDVERQIWSGGSLVVAGVDEVGRGAWAGPLIAAAVVLPQEITIGDLEDDRVGDDLVAPMLPVQLHDSKKLTPRIRQSLIAHIKAAAKYWSIGQVEVDEINTIGLGPANQLALLRALQGLPCQVEHVLVDGRQPVVGIPYPQQAIVGGDGLVASIAAASIIAKIHRDHMMEELARQYPAYGFEQHKGYGTKFHQRAISRYGLSPVHRTSFNLKFLA